MQPKIACKHNRSRSPTDIDKLTIYCVLYRFGFLYADDSFNVNSIMTTTKTKYVLLPKISSVFTT